jgi:hypothetical protein
LCMRVFWRSDGDYPCVGQQISRRENARRLSPSNLRTTLPDLCALRDLEFARGVPAGLVENDHGVCAWRNRTAYLFEVFALAAVLGPHAFPSDAWPLCSVAPSGRAAGAGLTASAHTIILVAAMRASVRRGYAVRKACAPDVQESRMLQRTGGFRNGSRAPVWRTSWARQLCPKDHLRRTAGSQSCQNYGGSTGRSTADRSSSWALLIASYRLQKSRE